jgi:hypothetical protein
MNKTEDPRSRKYTAVDDIKVCLFGHVSLLYKWREYYSSGWDIAGT